jgi:hypothetical protein
MSSDSVVLVGLDGHKDSIMVAYSAGLGDVENLGKISPRATDIDRLCKRMPKRHRWCLSTRRDRVAMDCTGS